MDRFEHGGEIAFRVNIARRRKPHSPAYRPRFVGQNIAKQIIRHDNVETLRVGHQVNRGGIHIAVINVDIRVLRGQAINGALPESARVHEHIGFVDEGEVAAGPGGGQLESIAHQALSSVSGVDRYFRCHFGGHATVNTAAVARVQPFGPFAHHHQVNISRFRQRGGNPGIEHTGSQINVVVKGEAQPQQNLPLEDSGRHPRIPDSPEQQRIMPGQRLQIRGAQGFPGIQVALRPDTIGGHA